MKKIFIFIICFFLGISSLFADTSDIFKGQLPENRKLGPVLLKYLQEGALEDKEKSNVKYVKFWFTTFDSENDRYAIEGREIFTKNGVDYTDDVEWALVGNGKSFAIQMLNKETRLERSYGLGAATYGQKKSMNTYCKGATEEIEDVAKKMTDAEYEEYSKKIETGRIYSKEVVTTSFERSFSSEDFLIAYWKISGKKLKRSDYLNFLIACRNKIYREFHDDEFELENEIDKIKIEVDNKIASLDLSKSYQVSERINFGKYDFDNEGYSLSLDSDSFFVMNQEYSSRAEENSDAYRDLIIKPSNYKNYNFMPIARKEAQEILEKRKSETGNVNRSISTIITFHFLDANSSEYKEFSKYWNGRKEILASGSFIDNPIPLVIVIDSMDAFSSLNNGINVEYIGEIISK